MKYWHKLQALRRSNKMERWSKKQAKMFSRMHNSPAQPSKLFMGICMPYMPIAVEGPTKDGNPVVVNPWDVG